ncbi:MAG: hypothetical protein M3Y30_10440 [Gemmatimonadota bacterium]|nr:hypothetical protein [Gemmatimonadota bacterium]
MGRSKDDMGTHLSLSSSAAGRAGHDRTARALGVAPHLNVDDIAELTAAIERSLCEGELPDSSRSVIDVDLRKALRVSCAKARLQRVRAEQLLVDVKQVWKTLPSMLSTRTEEHLNRIVSACIDEYYAGEAPPPS